MCYFDAADLRAIGSKSQRKLPSRQYSLEYPSKKHPPKYYETTQTIEMKQSWNITFSKDINPYNAQAYFKYQLILPSSNLMVLNCTVCHCLHLL